MFNPLTATRALAAPLRPGVAPDPAPGAALGGILKEVDCLTTRLPVASSLSHSSLSPAILNFLNEVLFHTLVSYSSAPILPVLGPIF